MYWVGGQSSSLPSMQHTVLPLFLLPVSYAAGDEYSQWNIPGTSPFSQEQKKVRYRTSGNKSQITVIGCISAVSQAIPPLWFLTLKIWMLSGLREKSLAQRMDWVTKGGLARSCSVVGLLFIFSNMLFLWGHYFCFWMVTAHISNLIWFTSLKTSTSSYFFFLPTQRTNLNLLILPYLVHWNRTGKAFAMNTCSQTQEK